MGDLTARAMAGLGKLGRVITGEESDDEEGGGRGGEGGRGHGRAEGRGEEGGREGGWIEGVLFGASRLLQPREHECAACMHACIYVTHVYNTCMSVSQVRHAAASGAADVPAPRGVRGGEGRGDPAAGGRRMYMYIAWTHACMHRIC